jgi:uncharacterized membrane protein
VHARSRQLVIRQLELASVAADPPSGRPRCTFVVVGAGYTGTEVTAHGQLLTTRPRRSVAGGLRLYSGRLTAGMHALTGWRITQRNEVVGMSGSGGTFVLVATYPDEAAAREDYQVVKNAHAAGLAGCYGAAAVPMDASGMVHENKDESATRHGAGWGAAAVAAVGLIVPRAVLGATAAGCVAGAVSGHLARGMSRSEARQSRDFTGPGQAGLVPAGESKIEDAIRHAEADDGGGVGQHEQGSCRYLQLMTGDMR